jgi:hypothetical protein
LTAERLAVGWAAVRVADIAVQFSVVKIANGGDALVYQIVKGG